MAIKYFNCVLSSLEEPMAAGLRSIEKALSFLSLGFYNDDYKQARVIARLINSEMLVKVIIDTLDLISLEEPEPSYEISTILLKKSKENVIFTFHLL